MTTLYLVILVALVGLTWHSFHRCAVRRPDDRGVPTTIRLPGDLIHDRSYGRHFTGWARGRKGPGAALVAGMALLGVVPALLMTLWFLKVPIPSFLSWPPLGLGVCVAGVFLGRSFRRIALRLHSDGVLSFGHCGSCGYGLRALRSGPDGCVVCPECGTAWNRRWEARDAQESVAPGGRASISREDRA